VLRNLSASSDLKAFGVWDLFVDFLHILIFILFHHLFQSPQRRQVLRTLTGFGLRRNLSASPDLKAL
jgi:hypothetical protein